MLAAIALAVAVAGGAASPQIPDAVAVVPDEPGAFVVSDESTYQAVAVDLDNDGAREVVQLIRGSGTSILAVAWSEGPVGWSRVGDPLEVVPTSPPPGQGSVTWTGAPTRLLVRDVNGEQRVTLVRQPRFNEPGLGAACCLLLHDLVIRNGFLQFSPTADPADSVEAIWALDLDGDGTDELLATQSVPPLGDTSYPTDAFVYRWDGDRFSTPTVTRLPIGSGDTPFVLGDTTGDGAEEAGIIATLGRADLYRISLADGDSLSVEAAGIFAFDALGVPGGVAVIGLDDRPVVYRWPAGAALGPGEELPTSAVSLVGFVTLDDEPHLLVRPADPDDGLQVVGLSDVSGSDVDALAWSPAATTIASGPVRPFIGMLPGGGNDGQPAALYAGRIVPNIDEFATLAGTQPIGFVGRDRSWLALLHAPVPVPPLDASGGRLDAPVLLPGSAVSLAPIAVVQTPEVDAGVLTPDTRDATNIGNNQIAVDRGGFTASVEAPPGSRIYLSAADPSVISTVQVVPESGQLEVAIVPPPVGVPNSRHMAVLTVVTPGGHGYLATWDVRVLTEPPPLEAAVSTPFGSGEVEVRGQSAPYATVSVAGRPTTVAADGSFVAKVAIPPWPTDVSVVALDPAGNRAALTVSGIGLFDYRGLPWVPITVLLVGVAAVILFLRVPRSITLPRHADDDAVLEELEPD